jgi:hypothetical protein
MQDKGCKFIIAGDWHQLQGVGERADFDYENSRAIWELCSGRMIELTHCRRLDKKGIKLFEMCKNVDKVDLSEFPNKECEKSLAYNNSVRIKVNHMWMLQKRKGHKYITVPAIKGKEKHTQETYIYRDMPLIAIESNKDLEISNADEFRVISFTNNEVKVGLLSDDDSIDREIVVCDFWHCQECSSILPHVSPIDKSSPCCPCVF